MSNIKTELSAASMAVMDVYATKTSFPWRIYRNSQPNQRKEDSAEYGVMLAKYHQKSEIQAELNRLYDLYRKPATENELHKITIILMDFIRKFDNKVISSEESVLCGNSNAIKDIDMLKTFVTSKKNVAQWVKEHIQLAASRIHISKAVLAKSAPAQHTAQCEAILSTIVGAVIK